MIYSRTVMTGNSLRIINTTENSCNIDIILIDSDSNNKLEIASTSNVKQIIIIHQSLEFILRTITSFLITAVC